MACGRQTCISTTSQLNFDAIGRVLWRIVAQWHAQARQRRDLARLNDRMLRDIGLTRADVRREVRKPFWRV